jgi:glyoxylase-like metal-dependent hydrolase (beta-lactamase superfamily II)
MRVTAKGRIDDTIDICGHTIYPGYLLKGSRGCMMIEAGMNILGPSYYRGIKRILGDRLHLDDLLVTHAHYDHAGSISYLKRRFPDVRLMGSSMTAMLFQKENILKTMNFLSEQVWPYFEDIKLNDAEKEEIRITSVPFTKGLKEGDVIDLGNMSCAVYETPGHTRDHLSFFIPEEGVLFPGEAFGNAIRETEDVTKVEFLTSYTDYIRSMEKLTALLPQVKVIALSHLFFYTGDDVPRFVEMAMRDALRYKALIEEYLDRENGDMEKAVETMVRVEYDEKKSVYQERNAYVTNLKAQIKVVASLQA